MSVEEARKRAKQIVAAANKGTDPELATEDTFRAVTDTYIRAMKAGQTIGGRKRPVTPSTAIYRASLLNRLVVPEIGKTAMAAITPQDIARLLAKIEKADGPVDETLKVIRSVFTFAVSRGLHHGPVPTAGMKPRQAKKRLATALSDSELKAIWNGAAEMGWPFGHAIHLLMLTGQRRGEIGAARWEEIDWERRLLIIPKERVKNRAGSHEVPLSASAIELLASAQALSEIKGWTGGFIFPSDTGQTPISGYQKMKARLDRVSRVKWAIHDLRHTFITRCRDGEENAEGEIIWSAPLEVVQATVNHEITAGVTRTYDHGDIQRRYRLQKRQLLNWWAGKLMALVGEECHEGA